MSREATLLPTPARFKTYNRSQVNWTKTPISHQRIARKISTAEFSISRIPTRAFLNQGQEKNQTAPGKFVTRSSCEHRVNHPSCSLSAERSLTIDKQFWNKNAFCFILDKNIGSKSKLEEAALLKFMWPSTWSTKSNMLSKDSLRQNS